MASPRDQSVGDIPTTGETPTAVSPGSPCAVVGRYAVGALHARGGLGEVYTATDTELNRQVALKRIQDRFADQAGSRRRFLAEAEITARLDHPGVVPVFGLVSDPAGRPCYAMRFVRGDTLLDQIAAHHRSPDPRGLRQLLGRFQAVCQAVGYAHTKGVIHRDLKPANVMVGAFGETLVVDWGLAKTQATGRGAEPRGDAPAAGCDPEATTDHAATTDPDDRTRAGAAIGTLAYMPPEQAAGRSSEVGPAADVYALGATLYHLLTGRAPVTGGGDRVAALGRVQRGEFPRPREVNPAVPKPLEAVCLKAMAVRPEDRYSSALALADDVERWLADDPVTAYRDPWTKRLARWAKRHRTLVNSAAAAVVIGAVAFGLAFAQVRAALARESDARQRADYRFAQARDAVNRYFVTVADDERLKAEDLQPLRRRLLADARDYFHDFLRENGTDPGLRAATASAHLRVGRIEQEMGDAAAARAAYSEGFARYAALLAEYPGEAAWAVDLAGGYTAYGDLQAAGADTRSAARESYQRAADLLEPVAAGDREARRALAKVSHSLGQWHKAANAEQAVSYTQQAIALRQRLLAEADDEADRRELALALKDLGAVHLESRRLSAAKAAYESARGEWRKLVRDGLAGLAPQSAEARILHDLGVLYQQLGDPAAAAAARKEALRLRERVAYSHGRAYLNDLARTLNDYGLQLSDQGGAAKADGQRLVAEGRRLREQLAAVGGGPDELVLLAESHNSEANLAIGDGRLGPAADALRLGREALAKVPDDRRDTADVAAHRGLNAHLTGWLHMKRQEWPAAAKALDEARVIRGRLVDADPTHAQHLTDLAYTLVMLGNVALRTDVKAAIDWYTKANAVGDRLTRASPEDVSAKVTHAINTYSLANAKHRAGHKPEEVAAVLTEAVAAGRAALDQAPDLPPARLVLTLGYKLLAEVRRKQGDAAAAAAAARDRLALAPGDPARLAETAADLAQCVPLAAAADKDRYAADAVAALTRAVDAGFRDKAALARPAFDAVRDRPDFQTLAARLGKPPATK
ncbi:MAG: protein kinase [Gemmataceae bacterium]